MFDLMTITVITGAFLIAGTVKGIIGLGLPTVSLGLLTAALDLTTAMALLIVPSLLTNLWQAAVGGNGRAVLLRIWPFLAAATVAVWLGSIALTRVELPFLSGVLGGVLLAYAALNLSGAHLSIPTQWEAWAGPLFGSVNGILTGMTGSFVVPGVMFLQGIGLSRDMLIQAMGMLFVVSTVALAFVLHENSLITTQLSFVSAAAAMPAVLGMITGQRIRRRLSEPRFRQFFFLAIVVLGLYLIAKAILNFR